MKRLSPLALIVWLLTGCFAPQQVAKTKETFTFDYTPKESAPLGSAKMVMAFVNPYYATTFAESASGELFKRFQSALGNDIEELIIAKGFSLKGPYQSFDEMVFEDKKVTEMLIDIEIAPEFTAQQGGWRSSLALLYGNRAVYSYSGSASLVGKINISGIEPLTHEKIWSKSVLIPNIENIPIQTSQKYDHILNATELLNDPGIYNAVGKALMTQYTGIMNKIAAHFEVEELTSLKPQIKELKAKKGF
jgi:hypothetical protein